VWIQFDKCALGQPEKFGVILVAGKNAMQFEASKADRGHWEAVAPDAFRPAYASASLILGGVRTEWENSVPIHGNRVAEFTFDCSQQHSAWKVTAEFKEEIPVDSEHVLQAPGKQTLRTNRPGTTGKRDFEGVQTQGESLCLLLAWNKKEEHCQPYGLQLVTADGSGAPLLRPSKLPVSPARDGKSVHIPLSRGDVVQALGDQHRRTNDNSTESHRERLKKANLTKLTLTVN
jgi:hypothetical protein